MLIVTILCIALCSPCQDSRTPQATKPSKNRYVGILHDMRRRGVEEHHCSRLNHACVVYQLLPVKPIYERSVLVAKAVPGKTSRTDYPSSLGACRISSGSEFSNAPACRLQHRKHKLQMRPFALAWVFRKISQNTSSARNPIHHTLRFRLCELSGCSPDTNEPRMERNPEPWAARPLPPLSSRRGPRTNSVKASFPPYHLTLAQCKA